MIRSARAHVAALSLVLAGLMSSVVQAQTRASQPGTVSAVSLAMSNAGNSDSTRDIEITLPSVTVSGAPRSFQVVSIPIPDAFAQVMKLEVEVIPRGDFVVLGPRTRSLPISTRSRVGVTIGIPANALAGRLIAAEARFTSPVSPTLIVPVEIDVNLVRQIRLRPGTGPINAQAGNDVILPFEISNTGNAVETVTAQLTLPTGWASRELHQTPLVVGPGETLKRRVRLKVPALSSTGSSFVQIDLRSGAERLASETMTIEVFNSSSIGRAAGPLVSSAVAHAMDENGHANSLVTLSATGALYDSVRIDARLSQGSARGGASGSCSRPPLCPIRIASPRPAISMPCSPLPAPSLRRAPGG